MKKHTTELIVILILSMGLSVILPGFFMSAKSIIWPGLPWFAVNTFIIFIVLTLAYFGYKKTSR